MFDRSHSRFELAIIERLATRAHVLYQKTERNLLGDLQSSLDFIHRLDPVGTIGRGHVHRRGACASPFVISEHGRMNGMERDSAGAKPVRDFANVLLAI